MDTHDKQYLDVETDEDFAVALELLEKNFGGLGAHIHHTHGYTNSVLLFPEAGIAARFPRSVTGIEKSRIEYKNLVNLSPYSWNIEIPRPLHLDEKSGLIINKYISGDIYSSEAISSWSVFEKQQLGTELGKFLYKIHSTLRKSDFPYLEESKSLLDQYVMSLEAYTHHPLYLEAQKLLSQFMHDTVRESTFVLYDDIHGANLVFKNRTLVGVLDFAEMSVGLPAQDLRRTYILDEVVGGAACAMYAQASDRNSNVTPAYVKDFALLHELVVYITRGEHQKHPSFLRAKKNLEKWYNRENSNERGTSANV
jgi:aminoglycoside phosphotransferase (APT) family kinase protein